MKSRSNTAGPVFDTAHIAFGVLLAAAAFALYCYSAFIVDLNEGSTHFGADTGYYQKLASVETLGDIRGDHQLERITRFHPLTVVLAAGWLNLLKPVLPWFSAEDLLRGLFPAIGAFGVWWAFRVFAALLPRNLAMPCGILYAASLGIWYFASIEESKILTASMSAFYIAIYLRLREEWTMRRAVLLSAILLLACLNEITSCFLALIPLTDALVRKGWNKGWNWSGLRWVVMHGFTAFPALLILEFAVNGNLVSQGPEAEGRSHLSMFLFHALKSDHGAASLYSFVLNWLSFSVAAPAAEADQWAVPPDLGYFEPAFSNYFFAPWSAGVVALIGVMLLAITLPRYRAKLWSSQSELLIALGAYTVVRALFFFVFNSGEPFLFSSATVLVHIVLLAVPFAASKFPAKPVILGLLAAGVLITNGIFIANA